MLLSVYKTDPVIVGHAACIIKNLSLSKNRQVGTQYFSLNYTCEVAVISNQHYPQNFFFFFKETYAKDTLQKIVGMKRM